MTMDHSMHAWNGGDPFGIAVVVVGALATACTFVLAFRWTMWPGETDPDHPKNSIMREDR